MKRDEFEAILLLMGFEKKESFTRGGSPVMHLNIKYGTVRVSLQRDPIFYWINWYAFADRPWKGRWFWFSRKSVLRSIDSTIDAIDYQNKQRGFGT